MANSLREVKMRIASTRNTAQITKAMYMVSSSKVKRAERLYRDYKDYLSRIANIVFNVLTNIDADYQNSLLQKRETKKTAFLLVTSDRGLAGAYNNNVFKSLDEEIKRRGLSKEEFCVASIGRKGYQYAKKCGYEIINEGPLMIRDDVEFLDILPIAKRIIERYVSNEVDEFVIVYNHYVNTISQQVSFATLLPIDKIEGTKEDIDYVFETGIEKTINALLPMYVENMIYGIILDAKTSEHSARMTAMKSATDNANEVIEKLQLLYNKARQDTITKELIDIVGGANAV